MKVTAVVLHKGSLATYRVSEGTDGSYDAHLQSYSGHHQDTPPQSIQFVKEGRHCTGDTKDQELMDELCAALKLEKEKETFGEHKK